MPSRRPRNFAFTDLAHPITTVQRGPETLSHPLHPVKIDPRAGVAVKVTAVSITYGSEQWLV
jgi:hypothetical protein